MVLALPLSSVRRTIRITPDQIVRGSSGASIVVDGMVTAFAPLSSCLGEGPDAVQAARAWTTVIVTDGVKMAALGVDRIIGTSRLVARSMPRVAPVHAIVAGCFLDVEGNPRLVLDPKHVIVAASQAHSAATAENPVKRAPILVVDDSLTTRMLEQSILESAGYEVVLAVSGEDGFDKACRNRFGLILVDVEMPGMDGFAFVQRVRAHPDLRTIPTILVTSRDSQADRRRGLEVGASGHISKGAFDQSDLLDRIKSLIG
jgi:two-component system chemotaxis sensor kinase CheA